MTNATATAEACERIVTRALFRIPGQKIGIHDRDDLRQELRIAAWESSEKHDGRPELQFIRNAVMFAVTKLYAEARTAARHPQDRYGRPVRFANPDVLASETASTPDPEQIAAVREELAQIAVQLPRSGRRVVQRVLSGRADLAPGDDAAKAIRYSLMGGSK